MTVFTTPVQRGVAGAAPTPLLQWDMDEGGGTHIADSSGNNHHGILQNADWVQGELPGSHAISFRGIASSFVLLSASPVSGYPFKIVAKFRNTVSNMGGIAVIDPSFGNNEPEMGMLQVSEEIWALVSPQSGGSQRAQAPYTLGDWVIGEAHFISDTRREIHMDGQLIDTNTETAVISFAALTRFMVGKRLISNQFYNGVVEWVRIDPI